MSYRSRNKNFNPIVTNASHAYAPSAIKYATLEGAVNFFQDPPDADSLIRPSMTKDTHNESDSESENDCRPMRNRTFRVKYLGLHFDLSNSNEWSDANRSRILLAALYLKDRFQMLVCHLRVLHRANLTASSRNLQALVTDLKHERMFQDVTVEACLTLYFQIVNAKRCLDAHLAEPTAAPFTPTHLYKIAEYLVGYDDEIQKAKNEHMAAMDGSNNTIRRPLQILDAVTKESSGNGQSLYKNLTTRANTRSSESSPTWSLPLTPASTQSASSLASSSEEADVSANSREKMEQEMLRMHTQMADLLGAVKTQQLTIETLQGRVNTLESDLSMSKEDQERLRLTLRGMAKLEE
ncbi:hypothetical protein BG000_000282 [Podila horticola]|nr:hypothetical protein BG000_000282 [Podila horticola]